MNKTLSFDLKYCLRAKDTTKERVDAFSDVVFLLSGGLIF